MNLDHFGQGNLSKNAILIKKIHYASGQLAEGPADRQ